MAKYNFAPSTGLLSLCYQGKTRDTFETLVTDYLAVYASNRLSTHNVVHRSLIILKGEVLTALTVFWLKKVLGPAGTSHHLVAYGRKIFEYLPNSPKDYPDDFHLRTIIVRKRKVDPIEYIVRNYLEGSLYTDYYEKGLPNPYGIEIPAGMQRMQQFEHPIFTPTDKSDEDPPRNSEEVRRLYPTGTSIVEEVTAIATAYLRPRNIALVDHKCEMSGEMLVDEILTPDSSRFTIMSNITLGKPALSLDKQVARDKALMIWNGGRKVPLKFDYALEQELSATYLRCFELITGMSLLRFQATYFN